MATPAGQRNVFRFGLFEADPDSGELLRQGEHVRLQDQPFRMLILLLQRPGEVVTREELREKLWPENTFVEFDNGLNVAAKKLRDALGDNADNPRFVETVPRRGYRFIAPVSVKTLRAPAPPEALPANQPSTAIVSSAAPELSPSQAWVRKYLLAAALVLFAIGSVLLARFMVSWKPFEQS